MKSEHVSPEQHLYARWLDIGTRISFALLIGTFVVYAFGIVSPHVAHEELPRLWSLPVGEYLALTGTPAGWGWITRLAHSDFMNYIGITLLALVTGVCYVRIVPALFARGERVYAALAVAELVVLALAASGIVSGGH